MLEFPLYRLYLSLLFLKWTESSAPDLIAKYKLFVIRCLNDTPIGYVYVGLECFVLR